MNLIDLFDLDHVGSQARQCANFRESQYSPCEDDCEITAPYIGLLPDESDHENGSPLNFTYEHAFEAKAYIRKVRDSFEFPNRKRK
tara:strand:- start:6598 stop:6855 length:258 start_codon:yes stop_codon:yes gene_type:complete